MREPLHARRSRFAVVVFLAAVFGLGSLAGCEELRARSELQDATKEYERGRYEEAIALCEQALARLPTFDTALYNCAIIHHKYLGSGLAEESDKLADRTIELFEKYLETTPNDQEIINLLTEVWMQWGKADRAVAYWEKELAKEPKDTQIMLILAGLTRQAGDWERSIYWYERIIEVESTTGGKVQAYLNIAKVASQQLFDRSKVVWDERLRVADLGIAALQEAKRLDAANPDVETYLGAVLGLRGEAHQAAWAQMIDKSESRFHHKTAADLRQALQAKQQAANGADSDTGAEGSNDDSNDESGDESGDESDDESDDHSDDDSDDQE